MTGTSPVQSKTRWPLILPYDMVTSASAARMMIRVKAFAVFGRLGWQSGPISVLGTNHAIG